jgi:hypothetical protein
MVNNTGTDAAPRSRAFALGFARGCRTVLLFATVFLNIYYLLYSMVREYYAAAL